ncbi:MAG: hypothetical protein AAF499_13380 [Pseudomonadota bacterium]
MDWWFQLFFFDTFERDGSASYHAQTGLSAEFYRVQASEGVRELGL